MDKSLFKKHAKLMNSVWDKSQAKAESGQMGDTFDDGRFKMELVNAEAGESKQGNFMVVFSFKFLEGDYAGKIKKIFRTITPDKAEDNLARIIRDINMFGFELEGFEQIESALEELKEKKSVCRVTLKTRSGSDYQDGYVDKILSKEEAANTDDEVEGGDEIPSSEPEVVEETVDIGSEVSFKWNRKEYVGIIKEFVENDTKAKITCAGKIYPVKMEDITLIPKVEVTPEPEEEVVPEEPEVEEVEEEVVTKPAAKKIVKKTGSNLKKK